MGVSIRDAEVTNGGKLVGGDDNSVHIKTETHNHPVTQTKLSVLFDSLKENLSKKSKLIVYQRN